MEKMAAYQAEQWTDEHDPAAMESDDLNRELTEVILYNQYVLFDNTMWKAWRGFPIGAAFGRELAEMYMHMLERDLISANMQYIEYL